MELRTMEIAVETKVKMLYKQAVEHYKIVNPFKEIDVVFGVRGRVAGWAFPFQGKVKFNTYIMENNFAQFLSDVVVHEVAHIVAHQAFPKNIKPHGHEWASVMRFFGSEPRRCHSYACEPRKVTRIKITCSCGKTFKVTSGEYTTLMSYAHRGFPRHCIDCKEAITRKTFAEKIKITV